MEFQAAVLNKAQNPFDMETVRLDDDLRPEEILVKVVATGICHTDIAIRNQFMPFPIPAILGHEGAGIVEKVGSNVTKVQPGDHVILGPASCGKCSYCKAGHPAYCADMFLLNFSGRRTDGSCPYHDHSGKDVSGLFFGQSSFATYSLAVENNVIKVDKDDPLEILGPLGCGLQTGAGTVLNVFKPHAGESIAIFGVGPVGLAALMAAKLAGCTTIVAVDVHDSRLALAKELGATHTLNSKDGNVGTRIAEEIIPGGVHYAFDTSGRNDVINEALRSLRPLGKCALVGGAATTQIEIDFRSLTKGLSLEFVIQGDSVPEVFIPQLISLYKQGLFPFDKLITFYELSEINQAVEDAEKGKALKPIIRMPH